MQKNLGFGDFKGHRCKGKLAARQAWVGDPSSSRVCWASKEKPEGWE